MHLKEIEINGFKSFADKVNLEFNPGITAIVGPNGSGKSNIVDAVRWVLGEQSIKSLRGSDNMTDVIFSGSSSRNRSSVASVTLILDNSDKYLPSEYTEIAITRRVYRNGDSEYLLNGTPCRLKDITDLIMDTGLGRDSFNIISQGNIQEILNSKPEDRRVIFEEAAGVLKYKKRKEAAIRKLETTNENLDRVNDIIHELETQLEPLKEESEKAEIYLENKRELEKIEQTLLVHDIDLLSEEYNALKEKINKVTDENLNLLATINNCEKEISDTKVLISELDEKIDVNQQKLLEVSTLVEKLHGEKKLMVERRKYSIQPENFDENILKLKEEELKLKNELNLLEEDLKGKREKREELKAKIIQLEEEVGTKNQKVLLIENRLNELIRQKEELNSKIIVYKNLTTKKEHLNLGVKSVLNNPALTGIHNIIGELIDVSLEYSLAIETSLGAATQYIVVDTEEDARSAVEYLKNTGKGRATFFPLNVIRARKVKDETLKLIREHSSFVAIASELVTYDEKYKNIVENQLGNIIIAKSLKGANEISKIINHSYKVVTLDGEVVHVGGSITGGNYKENTEGLLTQKHEHEKEKKLLKEILEEIDDTTKEIQEERKEISLLEQELYELKVSCAQTEELIASKENTYQDLSRRYESITDELSGVSNILNSSIEEEEKELLDFLYENEALKSSLHKTLLIDRNTRFELTKKLEAIELDYKDKSKLYAQNEKDLKAFEIQMNRIDVKLGNMLTILNEDYNTTYERAKEEVDLSLDLDEARIKVNSIRRKLNALGEVNTLAIDQYKKVKERYDFLEKQKQDLLKAQVTLLEIIQEMDEVMVTNFKETFEKIRIEFGKTFRRLFGGGKADLKYTNPLNMLETGIEMEAEPPGKRLQHLSLLSGGEKSLTAISLLFAILKVKPIPFCLLDEVESSLDDANIARFGEFLKEFSEKTQFIVVTHRKGTMEIADLLYGVTMQESGVSKLVSVRLEEAEKYSEAKKKA